MIVDLNELQSSHLAFNFALEPEAIELDDAAAELKGAVKVVGELRKGIVQTDVSGQISARVALDCTRCLTEIERDLEFPFVAAFIAPEHYTEAREAELNASDLDVSVVEDNRVDLTELVREQILLNLSEQVFCSEDCRGLCQKCGANLNLEACSCDEEEIDPRWAGLKNLR